MTAHRVPNNCGGGNGVLIGYARVAKADGLEAAKLQRDALMSAGVKTGRLYEDSISGVKDNRPGLDECLRMLRPGDTLVLWKLDRLGRNLKQLVRTVDRIKRAGVNLRILTGPATGDTSDSRARFIFEVFAALAELEREIIHERTRAGLVSARARGRNGGRPSVPLASILRAADMLKNPDASVRVVAKKTGISRSSLYRYVAPDGELRPAAKEMLNRRATGGRRRVDNDGC